MKPTAPRFIGRDQWLYNLILMAMGSVIPEPASFRIVRVNATGAGGAKASPYSAAVYDWVLADTTHGAVIVNLPVMTSGQWVQVAQADDVDSKFAATITVNAPAATTLDQLPPLNGTYAASFVMGPATDWTALGTGVQWYSGGTAGKLLIA